jgi:lysophospholipase L1-like esterase
MKLEKGISDNEKIKRLINYYKDSGLLIIGLNDSQGVNTTPTFFKKGLLEYLASALTSDELAPEVINAFSLTMNKTEHIDYFLKNNLSLEEIKLSQIYSAVSALEKVMTDVGLPKCLGKVGNVYRLIYTPKNGDEKIKISTSLKQIQEPVMIYSSGVNDLMREVGANPFGIKGAYNARDKKPNYYYTLEKTNNPETLKKVIDAIERNYDTILAINSNTDVYTLGAYIPKSLQSEEMNIFRDLVIAYNEELMNLCKQYGITFVDTEEVGKKYNNSENNFHISTAGHNALANYILGYIYQNKIVSKNKHNYESESIYEISNKGSGGIIESTSFDYEQRCKKAMELSGYPRERELAIADEHKRETEIFQKVLTKKKVNKF